MPVVLQHNLGKPSCEFQQRHALPQVVPLEPRVIQFEVFLPRVHPVVWLQYLLQVVFPGVGLFALSDAALVPHDTSGLHFQALYIVFQVGQAHVSDSQDSPSQY